MKRVMIRVAESFLGETVIMTGEDTYPHRDEFLRGKRESQHRTFVLTWNHCGMKSRGEGGARSLTYYLC